MVPRPVAALGSRAFVGGGLDHIGIQGALQQQAPAAGNRSPHLEILDFDMDTVRGAP